MNIFIVDKDPTISARSLCDKHVVKMIVESAQMLSTAHRLLDGKLINKKWVHPFHDDILYKASHINHPCNVWIRQGIRNYTWLYDHFEAMCKEYAHRYGKIHSTWSKLGGILYSTPSNILQGSTPFLPAIGDTEIVNGDIVTAYREFYSAKKYRMKMVWSKSDVPEWFNDY